MGELCEVTCALHSCSHGGTCIVQDGKFACMYVRLYCVSCFSFREYCLKYIICLVNFSCLKSSSVWYIGLRHYERLLNVYEKFHIDNVFIEISDWLLLTFEFARESDNLSQTLHAPLWCCVILKEFYG